MPLSKRRRQATRAANWTHPHLNIVPPSESAEPEPLITPRILAILAYLQEQQDTGSADRSLARQPVIREASRLLLSETPRRHVRWLESCDQPGDPA